VAFVGNLGPQFKDEGFSLSPQRGRHTCGPAAKMGQHKANGLVHEVVMQRLADEQDKSK
jgi:hypothetical protein